MADGMFHELTGEYVEHGGQQMNLREYLDYFEPLGSALSRLPDGTGGPFVQHFTDSGGRTIGSMGWVSNMKSTRFGAWKLWGTWTNQPMPAIALPLFWSALRDPERVSDWVARANDDADRLLDAEEWEALLGGLKSTRLREAPFREYLKAELARAYAVPLPHRHPIEIELTPNMLDLLPWLYLLGPVDPAIAQLKPNRFNAPGYQYILSETLPDGFDGEIPPAIDRLVDEAAKSPRAGWRMASELRARRSKPGKPARREPPQRREKQEMPAQTPSRKPSSSPPSWTQAASWLQTAWTLIFQVLALVLLLFIAWNVWIIRKAVVKPAAETPVTTTVADEPEATTTTDVVPVYEPDLSRTRLRRVVTALRAQRPARVNAAVLDEINRGGTDAADKLGRVAVELFLRRNGCHDRSEAADGRFSTAEQRAIRNCNSLRNEPLMKEGTTPDTGRAIDWLESAL